MKNFFYLLMALSTAVCAEVTNEKAPTSKKAETKKQGDETVNPESSNENVQQTTSSCPLTK